MRGESGRIGGGGGGGVVECLICVYLELVVFEGGVFVGVEVEGVVVDCGGGVWGEVCEVGVDGGGGDGVGVVVGSD